MLYCEPAFIAFIIVVCVISVQYLMIYVSITQPALGETDTATYREEWKEIFIISAEVYIFGAIMYIILGKGERQWWAKGDTLPTSRTENYTNSIIIMKPESITDSKYTIQKP